jgi:hypothetical protein
MRINSWHNLQALGAQLAESLPGMWDLSEPPPYWMTIITRSDSLVRILVDDTLNIVVEMSKNGQPLSPMGLLPSRANPSTFLRFRTRQRDAQKLVELIAKRVALEVAKNQPASGGA